MAFRDPILAQKLKEAWDNAPNSVKRTRLGNNKPLVRIAKKIERKPCSDHSVNWTDGQIDLVMYNEMSTLVDLKNT